MQQSRRGPTKTIATATGLPTWEPPKTHLDEVLELKEIYNMHEWPSNIIYFNTRVFCKNDLCEKFRIMHMHHYRVF